ncbi:MAG: hypothetical protein K8F91_24880, partial [Candidatus Obscuribacterales bacterium]|nr:hypothetical protein [Candidatus Obscuribacterales bacterium]
MRFGPIALIRVKTLDQILETQTFLNEQNNKLSVELGTGQTLHSFMHYPWNASTAPKMILAPDKDGKRCKAAIERIVKAYQVCLAQGRVPRGDSMWNHIEGRHHEFLTCLADGNQDGLFEMLPSMFRSELTWGLGKFDASLFDDMKRVEEKSHVQLRITDALMSFAEASGARAITNIEQDGIKKHLDVLSLDLGQLLKQTESASGLDISSPEVGACYGCRIDGKFVTIDSIIH